MTTEPCVVGIDIGTSMVKVGFYTLDGSRIALASAALSIQHYSAGHVEQDLDEFYKVASDLCRQCITGRGVSPSAVRAIAFSAQMAGVGIVDADHRPLAPFDSWLDNRCGAIVEDLEPLADNIIASNGCPPTVCIGPKMLWWQKHEPELCKRASSFVTAAGFVAGTACGRSGSETFIDPTHLHFTAVADVANAHWDDTLIEKLGIDRRLLPEIVESAHFIGSLTNETASDFGLPSGTPVAAGCGDTAASALGMGALQPGTALDIAGTAGVLMVGVDKFLPDIDHRTLMTMRAALPGIWFDLAYVSGAGQLVNWVCQEILGHEVLDEATYAALEDAVLSVAPGADGLLMSPHFDGRVAPAAPHMSGALVGLTSSHTRSHIARAALESVAFEYRSFVDIAEKLQPGLPLEYVLGSGGGTASAAWNQIKADVLGADYMPIGAIDPGTRGAAILAIVGLGHEAPALPANSYGPIANPQPAVSALYESLRPTQEQWNAVLTHGYSSSPNNGGN